MRKVLKSVVSLLTASMMCTAFSAGAITEAFAENGTDISSKISERLLEEYGVNAGAMKTAKNRKQAVKNSAEKVPVLVWCTEDIDHDEVGKEALPVLTAELKSVSVNSVRGIELSVDDILNHYEKVRNLSYALDDSTIIGLAWSQ